MTTYGASDTEAWKKWNQSGSPVDLDNVLDKLTPMIQSEVNRWAGSLARPLLELEAKKLAVEAIKSYSPSAGAALGTHVANRLKKLSRVTYTHQNVGRIPEHQVLKLTSYNVAKENLTNSLGRDPTADEMAGELVWSKPYLNRFQRSLRSEFVESGETPPIFDTDSGQHGMVDFVYNDMNPMHKKIFEHTTGYGGAKILGNAALMKKLKLSQGQYSYQKRQVINKVEDTLYGVKKD